MTNSHVPEENERWSRPNLERDQPIRTVGKLLRKSGDGQSGPAEASLIGAEDAVVAAVRMAYKVAQAQAERSSRLAQRLRDAGNRPAGARSDRKAIDEAEELVSRIMISALNWLEGLATEGDSPLRRLAIAQCRLAGSILRVTPSEERQSAPVGGTDAASSSANRTGRSNADPSKSSTLSRKVKVVLKGKGRPVRVCHIEIATTAPLDQTEINFYSATDIASEPLSAQLAVDVNGLATLTLSTQHPAHPGRWRAAVCDAATDEQIGFIEIEM